MELAGTKGRLEIESLPTEKLDHLKAAAFIKKKRALKEIVIRTGDKKDLLYAGLSSNVSETLLSSD